MALACAFPNSRFTGVDLCADAFAATEAEARAEGMQNLRFEARDLSSAQADGPFDLVTTFDAVHDQKDPKGLLDLIRDALREGGVYLMQEIGGSRDLEANIANPFAPLLYSISSMHCTPISIGQGEPCSARCGASRLPANTSKRRGSRRSRCTAGRTIRSTSTSWPVAERALGKVSEQ